VDEDSLSKVHINVLFDMLVERTTEVMNLDKKEDNIEFGIKRKEIELLQRIIIARRSEFPPG
jgi:hypothetical protein